MTEMVFRIDEEDEMGKTRDIMMIMIMMMMVVMVIFVWY